MSAVDEWAASRLPSAKRLGEQAMPRRAKIRCNACSVACELACVWACRNSGPCSGSSVGSVPSRLPMARPTRSTVAQVAGEMAGSFSARWISAVVQPSSTSLASASR